MGKFCRPSGSEISMSSPQKLQNYLDDLSFLTDKNDKIQYLIELAEKYKPIPDNIATPPFDKKHRVEYCESEAFVWAIKNVDENVDIYIAVESPSGISAKALAVILIDSISGESKETILKVNADIVLKIFGRELSMGKNMGLTGIVKKIHQLVENS